MRYVSLFAGIGGFDLALNRLGHVCVWANEWDKYAAQIYNKNFGKFGEWTRSTECVRLGRNSTDSKGELWEDNKGDVRPLQQEGSEESGECKLIENKPYEWKHLGNGIDTRDIKYAAEIYEKNLSTKQLSTQSGGWNKDEKEKDSGHSAFTTSKCGGNTAKLCDTRDIRTVTVPTSEIKTTTSLPQDFHAKLLALLENAEDLMTPEELSSLKSQGYLKINSRSSLYLKMLKDFYLMTTETLSRPSSPRLQNWGMTFNGKCLTARISESHRIGKECSLSDILEDNPDQKYFLSEQAIQRMNLKGYSPTLSIQATGGEQIETKSKQPFGQTSRIHKKEGISPTLPTPSGGHHIPMICESDD